MLFYFSEDDCCLAKNPVKTSEIHKEMEFDGKNMMNTKNNNQPRD
jgi:hypothetical protein